MFHSISVRAADGRLLGCADLLKFDSIPTSLRDAVRKQYSKRLPEIGMYKRAIIRSLQISTKSSMSNDRANSLIYSDSGIYHIQAILGPLKDSANLGVHLACKKAKELKEKPYGCQYPLPLHSVVQWTDNFVLIQASEIMGFVLEVPYHACGNHNCCLTTKLPRLLYLQD